MLLLYFLSVDHSVLNYLFPALGLGGGVSYSVKRKIKELIMECIFPTEAPNEKEGVKQLKQVSW